MPAFVGNGILDLFVVVAAISQHQHLTPIVSTDIVFEVEHAQVCHHALMFALIREIMRLAVALAIEGNWLEGNQDVAQNQDDVGPLMTNDISLAMIERFGIFRVQTGPVLQRTVDEDHDLPGQPFDALERLGQLSGLCFREIFQRGDGHLGMRFQQVRKEGFIPTATLVEHMLLTQGFMGTSTVSFPHHWRPQHHDSTWPNLVDTLK